MAVETVPGVPLSGTKTIDLLNQLRNLHEHLAGLEQDQDCETAARLNPMAGKLAVPFFINHKERAVRLHVACILASLCRLSAPSSPRLSGAQLHDLLVLWLAQIRGIVDLSSAYYELSYFLLESLATVRSIVLLLEVPDAPKLVTQWLEVLVDLGSTPDMAVNVRGLLADIGIALVLESDVLSMSTIGPVWRAFSKAPDGPARSLAVDILRPVAGRLAPLLAQHYHPAWMAEAGNKVSALAELKTLVPLIPPLFSQVALQIASLLMAEDLGIRKTAMQVAETMIRSNLMVDTLVKEWTGRANDREKQIRLQWVRAACEFMHKQEGILEALKARLLDHEAAVRMAVLDGLKSLSGLPSPLEGAVLERTRDREESVRLAALSLACQQYVKTGSAAIVNGLFALLAIADKSVRLLAEFYLDHTLLWNRDVHFWLSLYESLETKTGLTMWLRHKATFIRAVHAYIDVEGDERAVRVMGYLAERCRDHNALDGLKVLHKNPEYLDILRAVSDWKDPRVDRLPNLATVETRSESVRALAGYVARRAALGSIRPALLPELVRNESELLLLLLETVPELCVPEHFGLIVNGKYWNHPTVMKAALSFKDIRLDGSKYEDLLRSREATRKQIKWAARLLEQQHRHHQGHPMDIRPWIQMSEPWMVQALLAINQNQIAPYADAIAFRAREIVATVPACKASDRDLDDLPAPEQWMWVLASKFIPEPAMLSVSTKDDTILLGLRRLVVAKELLKRDQKQPTLSLMVQTALLLQDPFSSVRRGLLDWIIRKLASRQLADSWLPLLSFTAHDPVDRHPTLAKSFYVDYLRPSQHLVLAAQLLPTLLLLLTVHPEYCVFDDEDATEVGTAYLRLYLDPILARGQAQAAAFLFQLTAEAASDWIPPSGAQNCWQKWTRVAMGLVRERIEAKRWPLGSTANDLGKMERIFKALGMTKGDLHASTGGLVAADPNGPGKG